MNDRSDADSGARMTKSEARCAQELQAAYDRFLLLSRGDENSEEDIQDFKDGIHHCQCVLAMRMVRRSYPMGWRVVKSGDKDPDTTNGESAD